MAWINRSTYDGTRNGTNSHTVTFTAATAGNYLVTVVYGSVTSYGAGGVGTPPTGWDHGEFVVTNGGLYVFVKVATAGESSYTITHNGTNYPIKAITYEFSAGTSWGGAVDGTYTVAAGTTSAVAALPGSGMWVFAVSGQNIGASGSASASATYPAGTTEDVDTFTAGAAGSDGCWLGVGYAEDYTGTSYNPTRTMTSTAGATCEYINFALQSPATPNWTNHVAIAAPRNGTTTHTVNPATDTAVAGTNFTPTAGRLLLCVVHGPVTSTTPPGWTLPTGGSAVGSTGAYLWHRTAAGSDTVTTTHNGSNRPVLFHFFEFPAGSTFDGTGIAQSGATPPLTTANPNLTGLTGTKCVMALKGLGAVGTTGTVAASWSAGTSEALDLLVLNNGVTDGYFSTIGYRPIHTGSSYQPTAILGGITGTPGVTSTAETITWAVNVAAGGPTNYNETGRQINIVATVTVDDGGVPANPISVENALTGYAPANWQISGVGDTGALGYTTTMSVQAGSSIDFKIHTGGSGYSLEIVRLGWYNNNGARLVHTASGRPGVTQPESVQGGAGTGEAGTGSRNCTSWTVTDTWSVPADACHGVYLGVIKRSGGSAAHVGPFVVTTAHSATAEIMCKLSDFTWHAYNSMGTLASPTSGKSLYGVGAGAFAESSRAWNQSYDVPLTYAGGAPQTSYWNGEQPIHTWLERNGYDVAYTSCLDVDADPDILLGHKVIMSIGHDEYWSQNLRDAWDAAIDAGVNAIVASGNTMLWRVRMVGRTMWCYKDTHSLNGTGAGSDPVSWTGCWRDTRWANRRPENESVGTMFVKNGLTSVAIVVPDTFKTEPLWRGTSVASLGTGTSETLKTHSLGFEWDSYEPFYTDSMAYPPGLKLLSLTVTNQTNNACHPNGAPYATTINPANHYIVAFQKGTALVVNFGVNQWGYGLSDFHTSHAGGGGTLGENTTMKQATVNLLADMDCQPVTIQSGLTPATLTTWTFPTATALSTPATASIGIGVTTQLTATTTWSNGITTDNADYATWGTSNAAIATVSTTGLVTGVAVGSVTITATHGSVSDTTTVTVDSFNYTELEWNLKLQSPATAGDIYEFRIYDGSTPITYSLTPQLTVAGAGVNYDETNRLISVTSTVTPTDQADFKEPALAVLGVATITLPTDRYERYDLARAIDIVATVTTPTVQADFKELGLSIPIVASTTITTLVKRGETARSIPVVASTTVPTEQADFKELALSVAIVGTTTTPTDQADFKTTPALSVPIVAEVTCTDNQQSSGHYEDTGLPILVTASVTTATQADYKDLALSVPVVASTTVTALKHHYATGLQISLVSTVAHTALHKRFETLALPVTAAVTLPVDQADFKNLALDLGVLATVTLLEGFGGAVETGLQIPITATISETDQADFKDLVKALSVSSTVTITDQADYHQLLAVLIASTISATDLQRYANGVVLNTALALYLGNQAVQAAYVGTTKVWP